MICDNGLAHYYHLGESIFRYLRGDFQILFHFFLKANSVAQESVPCTVVSHLGLYCLPMSQIIMNSMPGLYELTISRNYGSVWKNDEWN